MDIASLLIGLLRASDIPARYVHGTIDVPADTFRNWAGGGEDIDVAANYVASGGIPLTGIVSGGKIIAVRMEHIWVEAAIDAFPSHGAKNRSADAWIALDPSFKQYADQQGVDVLALSGIDTGQLAQDSAVSGMINTQNSWVSGLNAEIVEDAHRTTAQTLQAYFQTHPPTPSFDDALGQRTIILQDVPILPTGLPYTVVIAGVRYGKLPDRLRHFVTLELFSSFLDRSLDAPDISYTVPLSTLGAQRLGITYVPATVDDAALIKNAMASSQASLPLYLISVTPEMRLDGIAVAHGEVVRMGSDQFLDVIFSSPAGTSRLAYTLGAGDECVIGVNAAGIDRSTIEHRLSTGTIRSAAENLHQIALHYWYEDDLLAHMIAKANGVTATRLPSVGLFSAPLTVRYIFGIPYMGYYVNRRVDIQRNTYAVAGQTPAR